MYLCQIPSPLSTLIDLQNLEYARSLLLRLEHDSTTIKTASRKHNVQADLLKKREIVKRIQAQLQELDQLENNDLDGDSDSEDDDMDDSEPQRSRDHSQSITFPQKQDYHLRSRYPPTASQSEPSDRATSATGTSLFPPSSSQPIDASVHDRETLLQAHRTEQADLTETLLSLARSLKESSYNFQASLSSEKDILDRAGTGLDKNVDRMDQASSRMKGLRRMTEGKGWWGRLLLYGYIAGLWVLALVLVLGLPKLRF